MNFDEPLLSPDDEFALARAVEAGVLALAVLDHRPGAPATDATPAELRRLVADGEAARQRFLLANLRLVQQVSHAHAARLNLPADELFQEGFLGLVEAVQRYDHRVGTRFATIALICIRSRIGAAARTRCGQVHAPAWAVLRHGADVGRTVPLQHEDLELPLPCPRAASALDAVVADSPMFGEMLALLPRDERDVLEQRYGEPEHSLHEVARLLGTSPSTIRRTHDRALARLREQLAPMAA